jgi:hypothetical protein
MGIRVDFLIKHVRPYGMDGWQTICQPRGAGSLNQWLLDNGVLQGTIDVAFNAWAITADLPIDAQTIPQFVQSASLISQARWAELYNTDYSTILFLNGPLINQLSYESSRNVDDVFEFDPAEVIPLAVTINRLSLAATYNLNVDGCHLSADANGNCFHFGGLVLGDEDAVDRHIA